MTGAGVDPARHTFSSNYVVPLDELRANDIARVGGKGANLGELMHAGFAVPHGFCVTTDAFARFLEAVPEVDELIDAATNVDVDDVTSVRDIGRRIRTALARAPMPSIVEEDIRRAWSERDAGNAYAVRSSATAEDLPDASFAGQQETILDVRGESELVDAVQQCWVSLFTDRAIVYRVRNGFDGRDVRIGVVVQRMAAAEASGVLFTVDPVSQHRYTLVIDAVEGSGEALVSGQVTPETYKVDRHDLRIFDRSAGEQSEHGGGTILSTDRTRELARLGEQVEAHFGAPQDLEWAVENDKLVLLQARPITSLYPVTPLGSPDGSLHIYFSVGHQQSMTRAMPPLSLSSIQALLPGGREPYGDQRTFLRIAGGRFYADLTPLLRSRIARRGLFAMLSQLDVWAPAAVAQAMQRDGFRPRPRPSLPVRRLGPAARIVGTALHTITWRDLRGLRGRLNARMDDFEADARRRVDQARPGRERGEAALAVMRSTFSFLSQIMPVAAAGVASTRMLTRVSRRWMSEPELEALTLGIPGNVVNEMNLAIDDLAQLARKSPEVARGLATVTARRKADFDIDSWRAATERIAGGPAFLADLDAFVERYGARAPNEIDLSSPRWREDPVPVLAVVAAALEREGPTYRERVAQFEANREAAFDRLIERAGRGPLGGVRRSLLRRLYRTMLEVGGMREHHKFIAVRVLAVAKDVIADAARRLHERGALDHATDVWYLSWPRLLDALDDASVDLRSGLEDARDTHARNQRLTPPMVVTSDGEIPRADRSSVDLPEGSVAGQPVSTGVVEGVVRVVRDLTRDELEPGEILVAEFTDPGWTPLFMNAAGLVLEVGGSLTHGAVVAREYGIPAVVGVREATSVLRTGQRVRVDGVRGVVEVIDADGDRAD